MSKRKCSRYTASKDRIHPSFDVKDVTYTLSCEPELQSIEGNASAIDDETDRRVVAKIRADLKRGNEWAWCSVTVTATWEAPDGTIYEESDHLGCCSYMDEKDFREGGYYSDMKDEALTRLKSEIKRSIGYQGHRWTLEPGRIICRDGIEVARLTIVNGSPLGPSGADDLARQIVKLLAKEGSRHE